MTSPSFRLLLLEGLKKFSATGYTNSADLQYWLTRLHAALERELPTDQESRAMLGKILDGILKRETGSKLKKRIPGITRYTLDRVAPQLRAELDRRIFAAADLIKLNKQKRVEQTLQRFAGWVTAQRPEGPAPKLREVASEILKPSAQLKYEARRVGIDQGHKLIASVAHVVAQGAGAIAAIWHDRGQYDHAYNARKEHLARSGKLFLIRDSWAMQEGLVAKRGAVEYTDEVTAPAEEVFCLPGSTRIPFAADVEMGYRRWYCGELIEFITTSDKTIRTTPNHPILTTKGWVAAGLLQEGDDVIQTIEESIKGVMPKAADHERIPTISQVFGALGEAGVLGRIGGASHQFHGDGSEGDVDIVRAARPLTFDFVTFKPQRLKKLALAMSDLCRSARGALKLFFARGLTTATSLMSGLNSPFSPFWGAALEMGPCRLFDGSNMSASKGQIFCQLPSADPEFGGQRLKGLAGFVATTSIANVKRLQWAGHVYNLQTAEGYYSAEGIISHNCSCWWEYITTPADLPDELLTAKGRLWVRGKTA